MDDLLASAFQATADAPLAASTTLNADRRRPQDAFMAGGVATTQEQAAHHPPDLVILDLDPHNPGCIEVIGKAIKHTTSSASRIG